MYVRLAFAVAAHLEPEILVVDEVLAVGDLGFQRKCLGKMQDVAGEGRTVLFVSHNMGAILELCQRAVLLEEGKVVSDGPTSQVVNRYLNALRSSDGVFDLHDPSLRIRKMPNSAFVWRRLSIVDSQGHVSGEVHLGEPFDVLLEGLVTRRVDDLELSISIYSGTGVNMFNSSQVHNGLPSTFEPGTTHLRVALNPNLLAPGQYLIGLWATAPSALDYIRVAAQFSVSLVDRRGGALPANYAGVIVYPCHWSLTSESAMSEVDNEQSLTRHA